MDRKTILKFVFPIYIVLTVIFAGCGMDSGNEKVPVVSTTVVSTGRLQADALITGKIEAVQAANVVSKVPGKVAAVNVDIGSFVRTNEVLVSLDADDFAANVKVTEAAVDAGQVAYDLAAASYERGKELFAANAITQAEFDNNYKGAYLKAEAGLRSAQANLEKAQISYADMFIKAPFNGIITARNINVGEIATTQTTVISMVNLEQVVIKGCVGEEHVNKLKLDQEVQVRVSAVSSAMFTGRIVNISLAADPQTKAYPVKIKIDNPNYLLKPGMFAEVKITTSQEQCLMVPRQAVLDEQDKKVVFVLDNGVARKRFVEVGLADDRNVAVTSGLQEGETIIVSGVNQLENEQMVKVRG